MYIIFFILTIFCAVSAQKYLFLSRNDICKDGPSVWRCKIKSQCPALKEMELRGQNPDVCSFQWVEPIICCPPSDQLGEENNNIMETTSKPKYWWSDNVINEDIRGSYGSWDTKPAHLENSKTDSMDSDTTYSKETISKPNFWWYKNMQNQIDKADGPIWGSGDKSERFPPTTKKTTYLTKSKAEIMCKEYSQYVWSIEDSPILTGGSKIKNNECFMDPRLIVGGEDAGPKEFPHMALIGYGDELKITWNCGGSLISPKFVLSAAHCSKSKIIGKATWVRLGDLDTSIDFDNAEPIELRIIRRINHPQYDRNNFYHDIALFELEREVKLNPYIRPLCLHTDKDLGADTALASGWGLTAHRGKASSMLRKVNLTIASNEKCSNTYGLEKFKENLPNGIIDDFMFCAGHLGKDTCQGDSGGPLQIKHKHEYCMYSQIGVVSFGRGCGFEFPGVYTRVSNYIAWIESIVWP